MRFKKQYELMKAVEAVEDTMQVVYDHSYYGLPSHLSEEDQKPLDESGHVFNCDPFYDELHKQLEIIANSLMAQINAEEDK